MNFLVIDGRPHKGNTWKLVASTLKIIKKNCPDARFEKIELRKENLPFCLGCTNCFRVGHEKCPHYAITGKILQKIEAADGIIFCSATYNWRETSILKNFFDHLCFLLHRPYFFTKKALILTTTGGTGAGKSAKSIRDFLGGIGFNRCYTASFPAYSWNAYQPKPAHLRKLKKTTLDFIKDTASGKLHCPAFKFLIPYNIMRGMGQHYTAKNEYPTLDGTWWTEDIRRHSVYYPEIELPFFKKWFGKFFFWLGNTLGGMECMKVTYHKM